MARRDEASEGSRRTVVGPSSDDHIHNQLTSGNSDSFEKNVYSHLKSYPSNPVLPLPSYTNEYQISSSGLSGIANVAISSEACPDAKPFVLQDFLGMLTLSTENVFFFLLFTTIIYSVIRYFWF